MVEPMDCGQTTYTLGVHARPQTSRGKEHCMLGWMGARSHNVMTMTDAYM